MSYYHVCPDCQANLDPGERCDCNTIKKPLSDCLIVTFDSAQNGDCPCITIGRRTGDKHEILNCYYGKEATEMYSRLVTQTPQGKIKII